MNLDNMKAQMRKGVLELCILSILSKEEAYASDIIGRLKESELIVVEGTLYPLLSRLKNAGLLNYAWKESNAGPPRKYFSITKQGEAFLKELNANWNRLVKAVRDTSKSKQPK
jgi:PadR family transcriptional regulator PadR